MSHGRARGLFVEMLKRLLVCILLTEIVATFFLNTTVTTCAMRLKPSLMCCVMDALFVPVLARLMHLNES
jgi:hypothetical protein